MKKLIALLLTLAMAISMVACGGSEPAPSEGGDAASEPLKVGILQLIEHNALDSAREGFVQALADNGLTDGDTIVLDYQNAQGDPSNLSTMSQRFVNNNSDLVLTIATGAAQSMASNTTEIPILFTAVTDPVDAGLVASNEAPGGNVSGTNDMSPIAQQIDLMLQLKPETKTVGLLYNSSEDNSILQIDIVKGVLEEKGIAWVEQTVTNSSDVQQAAQSVVPKVDAVYLPTDNVIASAMPIVAQVANDAKVPVICGEENMVLSGGLATLGLNYYNLGYQTGEMAIRILVEGADISAMPVESQTDFNYVINGETAAAIGIEIPAELSEFVQ
ncbi:MAG: ABC transporter substrate-binding protein [Oscillospiraceae bacterium]|nr:ABC transporter substrate-binding protein [Oscillospiraceae bacterium]